MLILARKESQTLTIGDNITVTIVRIAGGKVTLGIEAPNEVSIVRDDAKDKEARE